MGMSAMAMAAAAMWSLARDGNRLLALDGRRAIAGRGRLGFHTAARLQRTHLGVLPAPVLASLPGGFFGSTTSFASKGISLDMGLFGMMPLSIG
ncbi:hypothetical protein RvVAR031_09980 [Agrobacterium vitis]|nr:hypothetical protein RvVAR031_09980 [Agrobacterium vitis]